MAQANVFSGGSFAIVDAILEDVTLQSLTLQVTIQRRGKPAPEQRQVDIDLDRATPVVQRRNAIKMPPTAPPSVLQPRLPMDDLVRKLLRLCWMVDEPAMTGKLMQLAIQLGGDGVGKLPENM